MDQKDRNRSFLVPISLPQIAPTISSSEITAATTETCQTLCTHSDSNLQISSALTMVHTTIDSSLHFTSSTAKGNNALLSAGINDKVLLELKQYLPYPWICVQEETGINVLLLSRGLEKAIQRRVFFSFDGEEEIFVHRKHIVSELKESILLQGENCTHQGYLALLTFFQRIISVVRRFQTYEVCIGVNEPDYKSLWSVDTSGDVDTNPYGELRYKDTFRPFACEILVPTSKYLKRRCSVCIKMKIKFRSKKERSSSCRAGLSTPNMFLDRGQLMDKVQEQQKKIRYSRSQIWKLKSQLKHAMSLNKVSIDKYVSDQIIKICMNYTKGESDS